MNSRKIPVVKIGQAGATGSVEDFESYYAKRHKGSGKATPKPKLPELKNPSMQDRIEDLGLGE